MFLRAAGLLVRCFAAWVVGLRACGYTAGYKPSGQGALAPGLGVSLGAETARLRLGL